MTLLKEPDYGTPAKDGPATVSVEVDGLRISVPDGTSVMRAAALAAWRHVSRISKGCLDVSWLSGGSPAGDASMTLVSRCRSSSTGSADRPVAANRMSGPVAATAWRHQMSTAWR